MAKYLGTLVLLLGAILLIFTGLSAQTSNVLLGSGLGLVVVGYIIHIVLNRKTA